MFRFTTFVLLFSSAVGFGQSSAQNPEQPAPEAAPATAAAQPVSDEAAAAEESITKSDWEAAEARLDTWLRPR